MMLKDKFNIVQHLKVVTPDLNLYIENVKNITPHVDKWIYRKRLNEILNYHIHHPRKHTAGNKIW